MAAINAAWHVLSDPARRAVYDASLRTPSPTAPVAMPADLDALDDGPLEPGRHPLGRFGVPLPWIAILGVLIVIFVFTAYAASSSSHSGTDGVVTVGSCVRVVAPDEVVATSCDGAHDGRAVSLSQTGTSCPAGDEAYRDRKSAVLVCAAPG
jgi:molecular chaperone DnaJ